MLEKNVDASFATDEVALGIFESFGKSINDNGYFEFMSKLNGGFFYERSLQMYSFSKVVAFQNIEYVNKIFQHEYGKFAEGHAVFAQDALGNQFSFTDNGIAMFNCETAEAELLAGNFTEWEKVLYDDIDYLTARQLLKKWRATNSFDFDQRLCAKSRLHWVVSTMLATFTRSTFQHILLLMRILQNKSTIYRMVRK